MKRGILIFLFLAFSLSWSALAGAQTVGRTHLVLSSGPTTSYTPNILEIVTAADRRISGKVHLQFDIGPQGRAPMDWEKTHVLAFSATAAADTGKVEFSVEVPQGGRKLVFTFRGFFFSDGMFAGFYSLDGKERGAFFTRPIPKPATNLIKQI